MRNFFLFSFACILLSASAVAQTRIDPTDTLVEGISIIDISLEAGESRYFSIDVPSSKLLTVSVDTDEPYGVAKIRLLNGVNGIDKWFDDVDDFEVLVGAGREIHFSVTNIGANKYSTSLFVSILDASEYRGISSEDYIRLDDIKNFDFRNALLPPVMGDIYRRIRVKDGEHRLSGDEQGRELWIDNIAYGDLDGDRNDEAVVSLFHWGGGSGVFSDDFVYKLVNGRPKVIERLGVGDRAFGGSRNLFIRNMTLFIERYDAGSHGSACCPEFVFRYGLRWNGKHLIEVGETRRPLHNVQRIRFAKGRYSSEVFATPNGKSVGDKVARFVVRARAGQTLTVLVAGTDSNDERPSPVYYLDGSAEPEKIRGGFKAVLKKDGDFYFHVRFDSDNAAILPIFVEIR